MSWHTNRRQKRSDQTPWLNEDGSLKKVEELKKISQEWTPTQWENYLQTIESPFKESYLKEGVEEQELSNQEHENLMSQLQQEGEYPFIQEASEYCLNTLTEIEHKTLKEIFEKNKSIREVAQKQDFTIAKVFRIKKRALNKIKNILINEIIPKKFRKIKKITLHKNKKTRNIPIVIKKSETVIETASTSNGGQ